MFALGVAIWCFGNAVEFARSDLDAKLFWTRVEYIGVVSVPVAWLACMAAYTRAGRGLSRRQVAMLCVIPVLTLGLVWTNEYHGLIWTHVQLQTDGPTVLWSATYGPWFWVHSAYSYLMLLAASLLIIRLLRRSPSIVRRQAGLLLVGMSSPWLANLMYLSHINPLPNIDLTPLGFAIGALAVGHSFFSFGLFDVVPIGREALLRSLPDAVIVLDLLGRIVEMNSAAERLIAGPASQVLGESLRVPEGSSNETVSPRAAVSERSLVVNGEVQRFDIRRMPLRDPAGQHVGWLVVVQDVTERAEVEATRVHLAAEQAARSAAEAAALERAASEQRLRLALEAGAMGTWDWDMAADVCTGSAESMSFLNFEQGREHITAADVLSQVHPEDRRRLVRRVASVFRSTDMDWSIEFRTAVVVDDDGDARWLSSRGRIIRNPEGTPVRLMGVLMDITERKEAEQRREGIARAEQLRVLGQMAGGIAHNLNQSLALVSGHADLARQELANVVPDPNVVLQFLEAITQSAHEGAESISRLMAYARSRRAINFQILDVAEMLREVAQLTAPRWRDAAQAEARHIVLTVDAAPGITVSGDRGLLREALTNLVFNAVDALWVGGSIVLRASVTSDLACIVVEDSGVGMSSEVLARAFEPFYTTKGERGTGLGLAQVRAAIHQLNGDVEVDSRIGEGTSVRILLPITSGPAADEASPDTIDQVARSHRPLAILVVDDEERLARMMGRMLSTSGQQATTVLSAEAALDHLEQNFCELLITDLGLGGGMNGWELAAEVRRRWPMIRIVLATGWGADIDPVEAAERGISAVLAKPYRLDQVRGVLTDALQSLEDRSAWLTAPVQS